MIKTTNLITADGQQQKNKLTTDVADGTAQISLVNDSANGTFYNNLPLWMDIVLAFYVAAIAEKRKLSVAMCCVAVTQTAVAAPANACHHYNYWAYNYPQHCRTGLVKQSFTKPEKVWYVEVTAIPQDQETIPPNVVQQLNEKLTEPFTTTLSGTVYYKKPWINQCLKSSTPDLCQVAWEHLEQSCSQAHTTAQTLICDIPTPELK